MDQKKILENEMKEVKADIKDIQTEIDRTTFKLTHEELDDKDKKILLIKMNYNLSISEICGILDVGERTAFRRIENAFSHLADNLNGSKYSDKFKKIIEGEEWIRNIKNQIKNRRESYRSVSA